MSFIIVKLRDRIQPFCSSIGNVIFDQQFCFRFSSGIIGGTPDQYVSTSSKNVEQAFRSQKMSPLSESRMWSVHF